jgi:His-Xaa-Ser system protein HxsD
MGARITGIPWLLGSGDGTLNVPVDLRVYPLEVLFRTCYAFTDRCYLFLDRDEDDARVTVHFAKKSDGTDLRAIAGEFCNELVSQRVMRDIAAETRPIRELIVAQAFAEGDLLDRAESEADYNEDPRGIAR